MVKKKGVPRKERGLFPVGIFLNSSTLLFLAVAKRYVTN
jgi:hypothetical protein